MNLGELRTALHRKTGIAVDTTALTEFVNEAVQAIGEERDWPWQDAVDSFTSTGAEAYYLPSDYVRTRAVTVGSYPTNQISLAAHDAYDTTYMPGALHTYTIEEGQLLIKPAPASGTTVVHRYVAEETPLVADTDEPLLPTRFHQAIVNYASAIVLDRAGDEKRAASARLEYERWLKRMTDSMVRSQQTARITVRPGSAWGP